MEPHDIPAVLKDLPALEITAATTEADAIDAMRVIASFNQCMVGVVRFAGETPWERHPDDELLHVLEGTVDVTVLTDTAAVETTVRAGSTFIVPGGLWHRQMPRPSVALMFITSKEGNEASTENDPRR